MSSRPTTKATLALIPYLNCEPFYEGIDEWDGEVVWQVPRMLGGLAEKGLASCGPMAIVDFFRLREHFDPLEDFGISCEGRVRSVLLFARRPLDALSGARVGLTNESSTSVQLLRLLLEKRYELEDLEYGQGASLQDDARLLIGDKALRAASERVDGFPFVYDLGQEWHAWQSLPFVFARWVVSKELSAAERAILAARLTASLASWEARVPEITRRRGRELGLDEEATYEYLSSFGYRLGPFELLGVETFEKLLTELD
jgi:chorismate dehydratase